MYKNKEGFIILYFIFIITNQIGIRCYINLREGSILENEATVIDANCFQVWVSVTLTKFISIFAKSS